MEKSDDKYPRPKRVTNVAAKQKYDADAAANDGGCGWREAQPSSGERAHQRGAGSAQGDHTWSEGSEWAGDGKTVRVPAAQKETWSVMM